MTKVMVTSPTSRVLVRGGGGPVAVGFASGTNALRLRGVPINPVAPAAGQVLLFDGTEATWTDIATQVELDALTATVAAHVARADNPHAVTAAQVGAYTTAQADAITDAIAGDLAAHLADTSNPHAVTKAQVGLGNVENTALSTWAGSANITTVGTLVAGAVPASLVTAGTFGAGDYAFPSSTLTVQYATGSASLTPVKLRLRSTDTSASGWANGAANPWASLEFYSDTTASIGPGVMGFISAYWTQSAPNAAAMAFGLVGAQIGFQFTNAAAVSASNLVRMNFNLQTTVQDRSAGRFETGFSDVTDATRTSFFKFYTASAGAFANRVWIDGSDLRIVAGNLKFDTDNSFDIGASGATRPRDLFLGRNAAIGGTLTMTGAIITAASASGGAGFRLPHGTAPSSPVDGAMWTTTAGLFVRINGVTVGPLS